MSRKEYVAGAATLKDDDFVIEVTTLAPLERMNKGNLKETGATRGKVYDNVRSDELQQGITIAVKANKARGMEQGE